MNLRELRKHWHPVLIWIRLIWTHQSSSTTFLPIQTSSTANLNAVAKALLEKRKCAGHPQHPSTLRYAISDWVDAQDSALAWISGKVPSKCTPNFITVALPFLEILWQSRYFLNRPCIDRINSCPDLWARSRLKFSISTKRTWEDRGRSAYCDAGCGVLFNDDEGEITLVTHLLFRSEC